MAENNLQQLRARIIFEYNVLLTLQDPQTGLKLGPIFANIPPAKDVPGYRDLLKYPMSFSILKEKLLNYVNIIQWIVDISFLPWNTKKYYGPQSDYFRFADIIETHLKNVMIPRLRNYYPNIVYPDLDVLIKQQLEQHKQQQQLEQHKQQQQLQELQNQQQQLQNQQQQLHHMQNMNANVGPNTQRLPTLQQNSPVTIKQNLNMQINDGRSTSNLSNSAITGNTPLANELTYNRSMIAARPTMNIISPQQVLRNDNLQNTPSDGLFSPSLNTSPSSNPVNLNSINTPTTESEVYMNPNQLQNIPTETVNMFPNKFVVPNTTLNPSDYLPLNLNNNSGVTHEMPTTAPKAPTRSRKKHVKRGRPPAIDFPYVQRMRNVVKNIRRTSLPGVKESVTAVLEKLPNKADYPTYYSMISNPICFDQIWKKVKSRKYKNFQSFQDDIMLMADNFKRFHEGDLIALNKLDQFQQAYINISQYELARPDRDFISEGESRYPLEEAFLQNDHYKIGDWVLIANPNDSTKPIIGQIFKIWKTTQGEVWFNACWYFRPEQTVHRADRLFYKNEVVKSGHYRDHQLDELVGHCYVVHFTRYQRGDPIFEDGDDHGPLFVCEFRYNENDKIFNKIRTWRACLPEEIRDVEEKTKTVVGRRFFKFESPLKSLLPPNTTENDPIPEATIGNPNAPPLIGAVYLGPVYAKDDLGEFSTSLDSPRYIIRPGEPYEDGVVDEDHGLLTVDLAKVGNVNYNLPKSSHPQITNGIQLSTHNSRHSTPKYGDAGSTTSLKSLKKDHKVRKSALQLSNSVQALNQMISQYNNVPPMKKQQPKGITLTKSAILKSAVNKSSQDMLSKFKSQNIPTNNMNIADTTLNKNNRHIPIGNTNTNNETITLPPKRGRIVVDSPNAYLFPLVSKASNGEQIRTNDLNFVNTDIDKCIQRADKTNQRNRLSKEEFRHRRSNRYGEVIWFKGSSLNITERMVNLGDQKINGSPIDACHYINGELEKSEGLQDKDYREVEEVEDITDPIDSLAKEVGFDFSMIPKPPKIDPADDINTKLSQDIYTAASYGLRPSSSYMAYKLTK